MPSVTTLEQASRVPLFCTKMVRLSHKNFPFFSSPSCPLPGSGNKIGLSDSFTRRVRTWRRAILDSLSLLPGRNFSPSPKPILPADCREHPDLALSCHPLGA